MNALGVVLALLAVAGIAAIRHADRRARHDELEQLRRRHSARMAQTTSDGDDWWTA